MKNIFSTIVSNDNLLLLRAQSISGYQIINIIKWLNYPINNNSIKDKGIIGKIIEYYLIGKKPENKLNQDIPYLGIEIKTLTMNLKNKILNDCFICSFPLLIKKKLFFYKKKLNNKISKILWIPIIVPNIKTPLLQRYIGNPVFWIPSTKDKIKINNDLNNLIQLLILGRIEKLNYYSGHVLLIKDKSKKKQSTKTINKNGKFLYVSPKAFYIKKKFLNKLFNSN
ncbi:hypothetical protein GJT93_02055 [Enterobacteriaceae endosymbiont of Donacia provostii]|uniref:MutH/Sau3AI family endonuclease n=1 Tax=Enterobacteriaceae endosymbiont of Donacia provostii TaxID=2675781 RepID=UPI001448F57F|nr:MutH/Sau3AI family endonuclease [Enterobacteriaceae endosymbiont of Donacia provostii]QJC33869.1 hypothetical protein GJT93_02055 [Enterobacteriaceae endosymbiont of Donacia provostii]